MVSYDTGSFDHDLTQLSRETISNDLHADEPEDDHVDVEPSPPSRLEQLELDRIVRMAEAPQTRSKRTRAAQEKAARNAVGKTRSPSHQSLSQPHIVAP